MASAVFADNRLYRKARWAGLALFLERVIHWFRNRDQTECLARAIEFNCRDDVCGVWPTLVLAKTVISLEFGHLGFTLRGGVVVCVGNLKTKSG